MINVHTTNENATPLASAEEVTPDNSKKAMKKKKKKTSTTKAAPHLISNSTKNTGKTSSFK